MSNKVKVITGELAITNEFLIDVQGKYVFDYLRTISENGLSLLKQEMIDDIITQQNMYQYAIVVMHPDEYKRLLAIEREYNMSDYIKIEDR